jgi:hypothetical protein
MPVAKKEVHCTGRIGWLRAAVLGANDGILSTSSLLLGVATAHATHRTCRIAKSVLVKQGSSGHNSVPHCDTRGLKVSPVTSPNLPAH